MTVFWIAVALTFAIVEVGTVALFAAFLSLGAVAAAVAAFTGADPVAQAIVFAAASLAGIVLVRQPLLGYLRARHSPEMLSGAASMIGQTAVVVGAIKGPHERGHVRIAGEDWPALTRDGSPVPAGKAVQVVDIRAATLVVELPRPDGPWQREPGTPETPRDASEKEKKWFP
ncbi:MAG: NfeD family protein [Candidatus Dormibacteraeota bacterium]|nr:NfeD family protein [Candidatus Dormibacteraeota bacterium]